MGIFNERHHWPLLRDYSRAAGHTGEPGERGAGCRELLKHDAFLIQGANPTTCGGNNGGGNTTVNGVYLLTAFNSSVPVDLNGDGVNSTNQLNETVCLNNSFLTLNLNNTFVATSKGIDIVYNVDGNGNETAEIECYDDVPANGTWSVEGNNVLFTYTEDGESFTDTFTKQGNNLVYTIEDGSVVGTSDNGEPVYLTATITLIYTKQ